MNDSPRRTPDSAAPDPAVVELDAVRGEVLALLSLGKVAVQTLAALSPRAGEVVRAALEAEIAAAEDAAAPAAALETLEGLRLQLEAVAADLGKISDLERAVIRAADRIAAPGPEPEHAFQLRFETLTPGEQEALRLLLEGAVDGAIAEQLAIAPRTVATRRAAVLRKMGADSVADLARMSLAAGR
jgi:DNA-binding NarL/FixJ family response regulator